MLNSRFAELSPTQIFEFYLDPSTRREFERLQEQSPPKGALEAAASALNSMADEISDVRIDPRALPNLTQIETFRKTFLPTVSKEVDEAICDTVRRLIEARGSKATPRSVIELSLATAESPEFQSKVAAGTAPLAALAELLGISAPLSAAPKIAPAQETSRSAALSVYRTVPEGDQVALGLPASEAASMIQRYGLKGPEIADVGHAIADDRITKIGYMVLRDRGVPHQGLMQVVRAVAEIGNAPARYNFLVEEFLDPERRDPKELNRLKDEGRVISYDLLNEFTKYFSLEAEDPSGVTDDGTVTDEEESSLGAALRKLQRVFVKEGMTDLTDMLKEALKIGREMQTRDLDLVLGDDDEVDLQDPSEDLASASSDSSLESLEEGDDDDQEPAGSTQEPDLSSSGEGPQAEEGTEQ